MDWNSLVAKLYGLRRFGIEPGLEAMKVALGAQEHPDEGYDVITVAGTNGKGTVCSMAAAMLQAHGCRVGLYTSPHLIDVTERFRVDGMPLARDEVGPVLERILKDHGRRPDGQGGLEGLTFFEVTTLTACVLFSHKEVDVAVFEVGLGGRLDAVNALEPAATAVTTIGKDHTRYLGTEIREIALEKAGVFRKGVPAVIGAQEEKGAREALVAGAEAAGATVVNVGDREGDDVREMPTIERRHRNTAKQVVQSYLGDRTDEDAIKRGMRHWYWPGRFDELSVGDKGRRLLLDAAHNPAGLGALRQSWSWREGDIEAVIWAFMGDKEPGEVRRFFSELDAPVWGSLVENERACGVEELQRHVPKELWMGAMGTEKVLEEVREKTSGDILVFGSIFLLGEVLKACGWKASQLCTYRGN